MIENHSFTVEESRLRIDQYLANKLPDISRSKIQNLIKLGQVTINGEPVKSSLILQGNEAIECKFQAQIKDESIAGEVMDLNIIFEDDYLAVINKPTGLVVHPGSGNWSGTLLNGLVHHFNNLSRQDSMRPGIVHRLDKDTSGVIIIAKNDKSHDNLSAQFSERKVKEVRTPRQSNTSTFIEVANDTPTEYAIEKIRDILQSKTSIKTNERLRPLELQIYLETFKLRNQKKNLLEVAKLLREKRLKIMKTHKSRALMKDERTVKFLDRRDMDYYVIQRIILRYNLHAKKILQNVCNGIFPGQYTS